MTKPLNAQDFVLPEFRGADPADYERRCDGVIVRKDRWETGMRAIARAVGIPGGFEIDEVVAHVKAKMADQSGWNAEKPETDLPSDGHVLRVKFADGSTLVGVRYSAEQDTWYSQMWKGTWLPEGACWKESPVDPDATSISQSYRFAGLLAEWCSTSLPPADLCSAWLGLIAKGFSPAEADAQIPDLVNWVRERAGHTPFKRVPEMMLVLGLQTLHQEKYGK